MILTVVFSCHNISLFQQQRRWMNGFPPESDLAVLCIVVGYRRYCHQPLCTSSLHFLLPVWPVAMQSCGIPLSNAENKNCVCVWERVCVHVYLISIFTKGPIDFLPYFCGSRSVIWPTLLQLHACAVCAFVVVKLILLIHFMFIVMQH